MADLLADIHMAPRYKPRTQTAFARSLRLLSPQNADRMPSFNIRGLPRIRDMDPPIYVCAILLLNDGVEKDPSQIRDTALFQNLLDQLGLQRASKKRDVQNSHKGSLVLLEVFIYMIMIERAREANEADRPSRDEEELTI